MYFGMKDTAFKQHLKYLCDTKALEDQIKGAVGTEKRMGDIKKPKWDPDNIIVSDHTFCAVRNQESVCHCVPHVHGGGWEPCIHTYQSISLLIFYHSCRVLISTVNKSTDELSLVFFNNCFADEDFNNGSYADRGMVAMNELYNHSMHGKVIGFSANKVTDS